MVLNGTKPYQVQKQAPTPSEYDMEGTPPCARNQQLNSIGKRLILDNKRENCKKSRLKIERKKSSTRTNNNILLP